MAPAKKMRRLPPSKRALIEPYSSQTDTPAPTPEGVASDGSQTIVPSLSEQAPLSGSKTVSPSPCESNAAAASESCEASPFETNAPSPQSQPSGAVHLHQSMCWDQQLEKQQQKELPTIMETSYTFQSRRHSMHSKVC
ncbi:hypothetical protein ACSBR1_034016 [Camellia fascicularis]